MDMKCPRCGDERIGHRCDEILAFTSEKQDDITQAFIDINNAEALAKFLGLIRESIQSYIKNKPVRKPVVQWLGVGDLCIPNKELINWLAGNDGTVAMICALQECGHYQKLIEAISAIGYTPETLNAALQAACLEVIGNGWDD